MESFLLAALLLLTFYSVIVLVMNKRSEKLDRVAVPVRVKVKR